MAGVLSMLVLVRFLFVVRVRVRVLFGIRRVIVLVTVGVLMRVTVLDVTMPVLMVVLVSMLVFMFHRFSIPRRSRVGGGSAAKGTVNSAVCPVWPFDSNQTCAATRTGVGMVRRDGKRR